MPTKDEHLQKAVHNEGFVESLDLKSTPYLDWIVTGIFYASLHYIDAFLATRGIHPWGHSRRDREVKLYLGIEFYVNYRGLKDDSRDARYDMRRFTAEEIDQEIKPAFQYLKRGILSLLSWRGSS